MDPTGMEKLREAASKRMGGVRRGPGPGGSKRPTVPHEQPIDDVGGTGTFTPSHGFDGKENLPEGLGMPTSAPPPVDPPLNSRDFAIAAGPSLAVYAVLTFIPTMAIFQLIYNYFFQEAYFGGMNFYKLLYFALTGQLAKRMGVEDAAKIAEAVKSQQAGSKVPLGKNGKPLTPSEEYANITAKAKLVSAVLRSRRHEYHGLTDDDYLRQCVAEATSIATGGKVGSKKGAQPPDVNGKTRVKVGSGMLSFLEEEEAAVRSNPSAEAEVKCENLAIFIGVNTDETPLALEDAEKLCNRVFKDPQRPTGPNGTYRTCFFGCQGQSTTAGNDSSVDAHQRVFVKPTSANLMALVADIATCRVRQWNNVVVYLAAPLRAAPTGWLDDGLVRDESTNYIHRDNFLRSDLVTTIEDRDGFFMKNCFTDNEKKKSSVSNSRDTQPPFPRFTLEFLGDTSDSSCELSWVDLNLFLTRLREAILESSRLQEVAAMAAKGMVTEANNVPAARFRTTGTNIVLMLDAAYRPKAVYDSVDYITNTREGFYCDPTVGMSETDRKSRAASESKLTSSQQESLRLMIDVNEKTLFAPPEKLLRTLASLSLHEAVAYGMIAPLTPFTNFTIFASPRRNYFVEKAVRQSLQKAAWSLEEGSKREVPIKTPSAALAALMVTSNNSIKPQSMFGGTSAVSAPMPSVNNPRLVGFSDFVRCFMEGYFSAMANDGKVPTADVTLDKLNDPAAALIAPGIRGSVENSAFWCGRMTAASTALYLARHPQMMGFSDIVLPSADGNVTVPLSSGMSMASTASPGSKVPTTNTPLIGFFSRGALNDATFFSQVSLAPRGAPASVCPPLLLMPSQSHLRHCEEVLMPAIRTAVGKSVFHRVVPEKSDGKAASLGSYDLAPVLQAIGWNGELLRHFTDGIHFFSVPTLVPSPTESALASATKGLALNSQRYIDLLAQHFVMRFASSLLEHGSHSHFGTVPTFAESIRVLTVFREQAVMSVVFLNVPTHNGANADNVSTRTSVWIRALEYLHDVFKNVSARGNGEARISIILVPSPSIGQSCSVVLPPSLAEDINTVSLPPPSSLDSKTEFRRKWVLPFATAAASDCAQLHTMYTNTFADSWPYIVTPNTPEETIQNPLELEKKEAIATIVSVLTRGDAHASAKSRVTMIEEAAKEMLPTSLSLGAHEQQKDGEGSMPNSEVNTVRLYESLPEGYIAPLLRYLILARAEEGAISFLSSLNSPDVVVREVVETVLKPTGVSRRVAPTTDPTSVTLLLKALHRAVTLSQSDGAGASVMPLHSVGVDGVVRVPASVVFGFFDELLHTSGTDVSQQRLQFARAWTLFHDTLVLLGYSGLVTSHSIGNGAVVSQLFTPYLYSATSTAASEAAAMLKSDSGAEGRAHAALYEDLQPFIELNPLFTVEELSRVVTANTLQCKGDEDSSNLEEAFRCTTFRNANASAKGEERLLFATIAGHRMRFSQTSLWTRYIVAAELSVALTEDAVARATSIPSASPSAAALQSLSVVCFDVLDTLFVSNASQLMPLMNVLCLVQKSADVLDSLVSNKSLHKLFLVQEVSSQSSSASAASRSASNVRLVDAVSALRRARGYVSCCRYACRALLPDGTKGIAAVMSPTAGEWWLQLAHTSELIDGNVGRPITAAHLKAASEGSDLKAASAPAIKEYELDDEEDNEEAAKKKKALQALDDIDPRLSDAGCPIVPIAANRPSTSVALTTEEFRSILSNERPPKVQFMQRYEREDLGGDEPNSIEELESDADEDDIAELNARLAAQEVRRRAAVEANQAGILLATDSPVTEGGKCYYRGSTKDAMLLVAVNGVACFPWCSEADNNDAAATIDCAISCLAYVDRKLFAGHADGSISVCEVDTSRRVAHVGPSAHKGAPVTDIIPYARSSSDMGNHNFYLSYASGIKANSDEDAEEPIPSSGDVCNSIVTASKSNRCIRLWPTNDLASVKESKVEVLSVLDSSKSIRMKDPMSRCFFVRLARRGVDEAQLRQNVGNPEEVAQRRKRDLLSLIRNKATHGRKPLDEPLDAEEEALAAAVAPIFEKAMVIAGANDTILIHYGASAQGTQHVAEERFNDSAFIGTDGIWQHALSLTVPSGYEVTAAAVGPGPKGEARLAVAVSSLTVPEKHYLQQFEIARSR